MIITGACAGWTSAHRFGNLEAAVLAQLPVNGERILTSSHRVQCDGLLQQCLATRSCLWAEHTGCLIKYHQSTTEIALAQEHLACIQNSQQ